MNHKLMSSVVLKEIVEGTDNSQVPIVQVEQPELDTQLVTNIALLPHHSGRVFQQPGRFMFLG